MVRRVESNVGWKGLEVLEMVIGIHGWRRRVV